MKRYNIFKLHIKATDMYTNTQNFHFPKLIRNHQEEGVIHCSNPEYYGTLYGLVGTVFQSLIFLVGVLGNLMVVITVRGTKSLHTTTNCYLVSLALADLITLVSSVPQVYTYGCFFVILFQEPLLGMHSKKDYSEGDIHWPIQEGGG